MPKPYIPATFSFIWCSSTKSSLSFSIQTDFNISVTDFYTFWMIDNCRKPWWSPWRISTVLWRSIPSLIFLVELWVFASFSLNLCLIVLGAVVWQCIYFSLSACSFAPAWTTEGFCLWFAALSVKRLANLLAYFHMFPVRLPVLGGFFSLHKSRSEYNKYLASVE